jgi:hypothetical protein
MRPLLLLLLLAGIARADVIVINKREIRGEIIEENEEEVKIKIGTGVAVFARDKITEIHHESELETLTGEAHSLVKTLDAHALVIFDRAIAVARKLGEDQKAEALDKERKAYAVRLEKQKVLEDGTGHEAEKAKLAGDDLFLLEQDLDEVRVYVKASREGDKNAGRSGAARLVELANKHHSDNEPRWAVGCLKLARDIDLEDAKRLWDAERGARMWACGFAVRDKDGKVALAAMAPLVKEEPKDAHVAYLEGRAHETASSPVGAREAYKRALDGVAVPNLADLPVDWLRELARRRALGKEVGPGTPGFGDRWRRAESAHFVVYHELGDDFTDSQPQAFETARSASLEHLGLGEAEVNGSVKVPMYLFKTKESYIQGGGPEWAGGHVSSVQLEDGVARAVFSYPGRELETATMQHELGHVLVGEAFPKLLLPVWANEGVACYCEPDSSRDRYRATLAKAIGAGTFVALKDFLARASGPGEDRDALSVFYAESTVVFAALVAKAGSVKEALTIAARIARKGIDVGLRELNTDAATMETEIKNDVGSK